MNDWCRPMLACIVMLASVVGVVAGQTRATAQKPKTAREQVVDLCRTQSAARLKYTNTVKWSDLAKEEKPGTWLVSGIRTAKSPSGNVDQQFTCRVQMVNGKPQLRMINLFKESTQSGKDVFQVFPERR